MKTEKKTAAATSAPFDVPRCKRPVLLTTILLVAILAVVFWRLFNPAYVMFSNDGPLGGIVAEQNSMPSVMNGLWVDLNWLGGEGVSQPPAVSSILRTILSPLMYAKLLCPFSIFFAGVCAAFCFRQLRFAPVACVLGGVAVALNSDFFSTACWGVASQVIGFGAMFAAIGFLGVPGMKRPWFKVLLAGLAVGLGVIEAYDIGALFSVAVGAY